MLLLRAQLWAQEYWTYKHNWMEGLEKRRRFIETGFVKLASEPSREIMWLQASCKAASPQSRQGEPRQSRRQGLQGSTAPGAAAAAGQRSHIWENPALIFKAVCCGSAEYGNFISKDECLLCSSGCQHLARCRCGCQRVLAVLVKAGSQCFPTSLGFSNSCVNKGCGTGEGTMLTCSRKANDQRASYMGLFASVVRWERWERLRMSTAAVNVLVQGPYLLIHIILVLFGFALSSSLY